MLLCTQSLWIYIVKEALFYKLIINISTHKTAKLRFYLYSKFMRVASAPKNNLIYYITSIVQIGMLHLCIKRNWNCSYLQYYVIVFEFGNERCFLGLSHTPISARWSLTSSAKFQFIRLFHVIFILKQKVLSIVQSLLAGREFVSLWNLMSVFCALNCYYSVYSF